jgi:hypothetical protein
MADDEVPNAGDDRMAPEGESRDADTVEQSSAPDLAVKPDWVVPSWLRLPRLEAVLGCRVDEVDWACLESLIDRGVREDLSIEFKSTAYNDDDKGRFELPKDVAAFANSAGGLIVVGMSERAGGVVSGFSRLRPTDATKRDMMTNLLAGLTPFVPDIELGLIEDPHRPGEGCVLVLVPPSESAPHAVVTKNPQTKRRAHAMSWPAREGSRTRWLSEPELAERYRARFAGRDALSKRVDTTLTDGLGELDRTNTVWVAVALSPSRPAPRRMLSLQLKDELRDAQRSRRHPALPGPAFSSQSSFGPGRVILSNRFDLARRSSDHHVEVHTDGSVFAAARVGMDVDVHQVQKFGLSVDAVGAIDAVDVVTWSATLLRLAATYSVDIGASGDYDIRVQLVSGLASDASSGEMEDPSELPVVLTEGASMTRRLVPGSFPAAVVGPIEAVSSAAIAASAPDLIRLAARVSNEVFALFGQLPTDPLLTSDGLVIEANCSSPRAQSLLSWAVAHEVVG